MFVCVGILMSFMKLEMREPIKDFQEYLRVDGHNSAPCCWILTVVQVQLKDSCTKLSTYLGS